ncbi:MAG TPA: (d)CMP kinase [Lachnospiraceae bacterium]|nr:(d)CMP kinase [Lachnospiraceae bacterium]
MAIDGPAGAGKSTIAKAVSKKLNSIYVDTGAMYRSIALFMIRNNVSKEDTASIAAKCKDADVTINYEGGVQNVILNGENVNGLIRTEEVGNMASVVSAVPEVRAHLLQLQRNLAASTDVVMDGRDIGTTVLPDANLKVYLTASSKVRAKRRYDELTAKGESCDIDVIEKDIIDRDHRDMTREISPLKQADDAILVDSSDMTIEEVENKIIELAKAAGK